MLRQLWVLLVCIIMVATFECSYHVPLAAPDLSCRHILPKLHVPVEYQSCLLGMAASVRILQMARQPLKIYRAECLMTHGVHWLDTGLTEVFLTGGLPPDITQPCAAHSAYRSLYKRVLLQNAKFYTRFPEDVAQVQRIVEYLAGQSDGGAKLPGGTMLRPRCVLHASITSATAMALRK